jgi:hypothetical protein
MPREFWIFHQKNEAMEWREFFPFRERVRHRQHITRHSTTAHLPIVAIILVVCQFTIAIDLEMAPPRRNNHNEYVNMPVDPSVTGVPA